MERFRMLCFMGFCGASLNRGPPSVGASFFWARVLSHSEHRKEPVMKTFLLLTLTAIFSTSGLLACTVATTETIPPLSQTNPIPVRKTMKAFGCEQELGRF